MNLPESVRSILSRRAFLSRASTGLGSLALASLLDPRALRAAGANNPGGASIDKWPGVVNPPHVTPKAKRVIYLYMAGGPSHLETFDYKPKLAEMNGKPMPESFTKGQPIAQLQGQKLTCLAPQHPFEQVRRSRASRSAAVFPDLGKVADDICIIRSLHTEAINHDPAHTFMNTGTTISGRPAMGSWLTYGLGSECDNLPGFVVLTSLGQIRPGAADRLAAVAQRLSAEPLPGRRVPLQGRPGPLRQPPRRRQRRAAARRGRQRAGAQPSASGNGRRSRDRHPHQPVRDGIPHADRACPS